MLTANDNRTAVRRAVLIFLALFLSAHAYSLLNLTLSGGGLKIYVGGSAGESIAAGCWARPLYERMRGGISAPWLMGVLSALYLAASFLLIRDLLSIRSPIRIAALAGILSLHPSVLNVLIAEMNHADTVFLALLLSCAGAWLTLRKKNDFLFAAALWGIAASLSPSLLLYGPMLLLAAGRAGAEPAAAGGTRRTALSCVLASLSALALYACGLFVMLRRYGLSLSFQPDAAGLLPGAAAPLRSYLLPFSAYAPLSAVFFTALAVFCALAAIRMRKMNELLQAALRLCGLLLLFGISAVLSGVRMLSLIHPLLAVFFLSLLPEETVLPRLFRLCAASVLAVVFMGQIVYANQMHLLKNLEFQSTVSLMTRVLDRIERTEGFLPGKSDVALLGSPGESPLAVPHEGFEALSDFPGAQKHMAAFSESDDAAFVWQIMGYPLNLVSDAEKERLKALSEVRDMPAFPAAGSVAWVGNVLAVKLSH